MENHWHLDGQSDVNSALFPNTYFKENSNDRILSQKVIFSTRLALYK